MKFKHYLLKNKIQGCFRIFFFFLEERQKRERGREREEETEGRREGGKEKDQHNSQYFAFLEFGTYFNHFSVPPASHPVSPFIVIFLHKEDRGIFKSILDLLNREYVHHS